MLIEAAWVDASDGGAFDSINPATSQFYSRQGEKMTLYSVTGRVENFSFIDLRKMPNYPLGTVEGVES